MRKPYDPFLRVLVKRPGLPLRAEVVENTLRSMQELVDGPIECVTVTDDLAIVCNEEGRLRGLSPSASILGETQPVWEPIFEPDAAMLSLIGDGAVKINQAIPGFFNADGLRDLTGIRGGQND